MSINTLAILLSNNGTSYTPVIKSLICLNWEMRIKNISFFLKQGNAQTL